MARPLERIKGESRKIEADHFFFSTKILSHLLALIINYKKYKIFAEYFFLYSVTFEFWLMLKSLIRRTLPVREFF